MKQMTADKEATEFESIHDAVAALDEGDTFQIFGGEYRVDEKVECDVRPWLTIQKKSIGGWMPADTRLEQADPTEPSEDDTIVVKIDRKHGWDERFTCDVSNISA